MSEPEKVTLYWPRGPFFWLPKAKYAVGHTLNGKRHGKWIFWYKTGEKQMEGEYLNGQKTGMWTQWNESGAKITEGTFLHDKMHGVWTDWYRNGQRAQESHWFYGKRDGKWTRWTLSGELEAVENHDHRTEQDRGYSLHTDRETKEILREMQKRSLQRNWEMLVGKSVASLVKPWHIACWILFFVVAFGLIKAGTAWRSAALAGIVALAVTSLLAWRSDKRNDE